MVPILGWLGAAGGDAARDVEVLVLGREVAVQGSRPKPAGADRAMLAGPGKGAIGRRQRYRIVAPGPTAFAAKVGPSGYMFKIQHKSLA